MEVYTGLVPNEFVGFHPMKHYNRNFLKQKGIPLLLAQTRALAS